MLFHMQDFLLFPKENQVNREEHPDGMHAGRRHDPEPFTELRPPLGLAEQTYKPSKIAVGKRRLRSHKRLARLVVHVQPTISSVMGHHAPHLLLILPCRDPPSYRAEPYSIVLRLRR